MIFGDPQPTTPADPFEVTAMVDIVFILLAFFVMTATLRTFEHGLVTAAAPPAGEAALAAEDLPDQIVIELRPGDAGVDIRLAHASLAPGDFDAITRKLGRINLPDTPVVLRADPTLTVAQVAPAIEAVLVSPMKKLALARLGGDTRGNQPP